MAAQAPDATEGYEQTWFGHPRGLFVLFFAEMWERFCYYGMRALLALYVAEQFTNGDRTEAGKMYGAFTALVYALGFFGGSIADKVLGYRRAIILGGVLMAVGEFILMIPNEKAFLAGLAILIVGNGLFKPNISTLVGKLYKQGDPRRDGGFTIFYMGINLGAFLAPLVCRYVAGVMGTGDKPDYRWGFITAGIGMLLGVVTFWRGFSKLGDKGLPPPGREGFGGVIAVTVGGLAMVPLVFLLLSKADLAGYVCLALMIGIVAYLLWYGWQRDKVTFQRIIALVILLLGNIVFWASFEQAGNSLNFFARDNVKLKQEERFPLGGTRGRVLDATSTSLVLDTGFSRDEAVDITVTYPSKENPNVRVEAAATLPAGNREARAPIPIADMLVSVDQKDPRPPGLVDNKQVDRTQDIVDAVAAAGAARVAAGEAAGRAGAAGAESTETPNTAAKEEAASAQSRADKLAVDFVVGPVRSFEWFQSVNAIFIVMLGPLFSWLWVFLDRKGRNPSIPFKFGLGLVQVGLGFALIVWSFRGADEAGLVPWFMLTGLYLIHTTGELCISPVGLSMVTKLAPPTITGFVMGGWFLSIANANYAAALFSAVAGGGGHGAEATQTGAEALAVYESAYVPIIWMSVGVGVLFLVLAKPINKLMHGVK